MTAHDLIAADLVTGAKRRRRRKMTLKRALRQAAQAHVDVKAATITSDGITLEFGGSDRRQPNEWDEVK